MTPPAEASGGETGWRQVGACVLNAVTNTVAALRWVPARGDLQRGADDNLVYRVPEASQPFLNAALQRTCERGQPIPVYEFQPDGHYALGMHRVTSWTPPVATLQRVAAGDAAAEKRSHSVAADSDRSPPPTILDVLRAWHVDVVAEGVSFPLTAAASGQPPAPFVPDALLHRVLSPATRAWCGEWDRLGSSCLVQTFAEYPSAADFARARTVVRQYHYPVLFLFGVPSDTTIDPQRNAGLQAILFHPGRAETSRAHFRWAPACELVIGEIGDVD